MLQSMGHQQLKCDRVSLQNHPHMLSDLIFYPSDFIQSAAMTSNFISVELLTETNCIQYNLRATTATD